MTNNQNIAAALNQAIADVQELLKSFAFQDELLGDLTTAFGDNYDRTAAEDLVTQWQNGEFGSFPEIEIRSSDTINGANGAYSVDTNKIYISEEYLLANADRRRDQIGFDNVPEITGFDSLERWNSGTSGFIGYEGRALAELVGRDATKLDFSDFIFDTTGTAIG